MTKEETIEFVKAQEAELKSMMVTAATRARLGEIEQSVAKSNIETAHDLFKAVLLEHAPGSDRARELLNEAKLLANLQVYDKKDTDVRSTFELARMVANQWIYDN